MLDKKGLNEILGKRFKEQNQELTSAYNRQSKLLLEEFEHRLSVIAEVQVEHTKKFEAVFKKLDAIMEMTALNSENIEMIKGMLKRKVDLEEYEKLERRVSLLEKKLYGSGI